jgi:hypothetical protein
MGPCSKVFSSDVPLSLRLRVGVIVLELGIAFHSVIIGIGAWLFCSFVCLFFCCCSFPHSFAHISLVFPHSVTHILTAQHSV